ncbi:cell division protein ZapA [Bacillus sp. Marseille-P3661]|uniref:cell division protein ZapA n=1 Tax=Bacillus sp. Marseille-P3661 TaxID=1936234 RepID=UPI000C835CE9|nr:cell division protein ZapA [Bacillus sp. Marseille-P3661]
MSGQNKKRISVEIYGQHYTIVGDENSSHIRKVSNMVDEKMREINDANPYLDTSKLAVLTALNIVNDFLKLQNEYDDLTKEYQILLKKLAKEEEETEND